MAVLLETLDVLALKTERRSPAPEVYAGRHAIYTGAGVSRHGSATFTSGAPSAVSDALALELARRPDFVVTEPTFHARGPGCC
jgi:hypothetical protein